jgi:hypothetical protein
MNSYNGFPGELRQRSWTWAKAEIKAGRQAPASKCCACEQIEGPLDYHCEDYSEPFGPHIFEFPMCFVCHMMVHCRFRNTEAWKRYREAIAGGVCYAPAPGRSFDYFGSAFLVKYGTGVPFVQHDPPEVRVLDNIEAGVYRKAGA